MNLPKFFAATIPFFILFVLATLFSPVANADNGGLVTLINQYRASKGLPKLVEDQRLTNAACWLAKDMAARRKMSHTDSLGRSMAPRLAAFGVTGGTRGENIAKVWQNSSGQPVFNMWKNSSGHNSIMLNPSFRRIGVGRKLGGSHYYWAADFASGTAVRFTTACGATPTVLRAQSTPKPPPPAPPTTKKIVSAEKKPKVAGEVSEPKTTTKSASVTSSAKLKYFSPNPLGIQSSDLPTQKYLGLYMLAGFNLLIVMLLCWFLVQPKRFYSFLHLFKKKP